MEIQRMFKQFVRFRLAALFLAILAFNCLYGFPVRALSISREGISLLFPAHQVLKGQEISMGGSILSEFTHKIDMDQTTGEIRVSTIANDFEYRSYLDTSLQVQASVFVFRNPAMIKSLGHDKRVTKLDKIKKTLEIEYFLNGSLQKLKKIPCDLNSIDSDNLLVFLQGMLLKNPTSINMNIIQKAKGLKVNVDFKLLATNDLQLISSQYKFPSRYIKKINPLEEYYVYEMDLTGVPRLVYPYKYYFAYKKEPPYQMVAYWGGASNEEEFGYILEYL